MNVNYELNAIEFVWDADKAESKLDKHDGISFERACTVFFDPFFITKDASWWDLLINPISLSRCVFALTLPLVLNGCNQPKQEAVSQEATEQETISEEIVSEKTTSVQTVKTENAKKYNQTTPLQIKYKFKEGQSLGQTDIASNAWTDENKSKLTGTLNSIDIGEPEAIYLVEGCS